MNTKYIVLLAFIVILAASCKKESDSNLGNPVEVKGFTSYDGLKSTLNVTATEWTSGDRIGLYTDNATINGLPVTNGYLTADFSGINTTFSSNPAMQWGSVSAVHNYDAYFPYDNLVSSDKTNVAFNLASAQTQASGGSTAHVGNKLDFMIANHVTKSAGDQTAVTFTFNHVYTVLDITVKVPNNRFLKSLSLTAPGTVVLAGSGTVDITAPTAPTNYTLKGLTGSNVVTVTLTTPIEKTTTHIYMVILPGTYSGTFTFTTTSFDINGLNPLTTNDTRTNMNLTRGKIYTVAFTGPGAGTIK